VTASIAAEGSEQPAQLAIRLVVDDHEIARAGLRSILASERDFEVVGEAGSDDDLLALVAQTRPDVVLLNPRLRARGGPDVCAQLLDDDPDLRILIVSTYSEIDLVRECIAAGAHGYVIKAIGRVELAQAVRSVHRGAVAVSPAVAAGIIDQMRTLVRVRTNTTDWHAAAVPFATPAHLTSREREILDRLLDGDRVHSIANELFVSQSTVRNHLSSIFKKVGVHSQAELIARLRSS
jgi:two-component system response regulator DevR